MEKFMSVCSCLFVKTGRSVALAAELNKIEYDGVFDAKKRAEAFSKCQVSIQQGTPLLM